MQIFEVKNLTYTYDKFDKSNKEALSNVSFSIDKGTFTAIIGKSGSGKSTLVSHLNGILKADSGDILYCGESIYGEKFNLTGLRYKCGVLFQYPDYQLFADTVIEDVAFGPTKKGLSKEEAYEISLSKLKLLGVDSLKDESPFNLSGGEKRKVALAGILSMEPEVLILDEPDAGLDFESKKSLYNFLNKLKEDFDTTIIIVTHNLDDVIEYADNALLLDEGRLVFAGKPMDALSDDNVLNKASLIKPTSIRLVEVLSKNGILIDKKSLKYEDILKELISHKK